MGSPKQQQEEPEIGSYPKAREGLEALDKLMAAWICCPMPFLHVGVGDRVPGGGGLFALAVLWMFSYASPVWFLFFWVWLGAMILMRLRRDKNAHSYYSGRKWLAMRFPFVKRETTATFVECLICFGVGIAFLPIDKEFGTFVISWCLPLGYMEAVREQVERQSRRNIRDKGIEMGYYASMQKRM